MSDNVIRIGVNTSGINPYAGGTKGNEPQPEDKKPDVAVPNPTHAPVNPNDVLNHMAAAAVGVNPSVAPPKTYNVEMYVTPEQAARIAGSMELFEEAVAKGLLAIEDEFGDWLSDPSKYALAAGLVS